MTTTINASTSAGLVQTADTSGILALQTANTTAVTIDASQNVGIGTASPSYKLDVQGTTANQRISSTTGTNAAYEIFSNTGQNFYVGLDNSAGNQILSAAYGATLLGTGAYPMVFGTNNSERMRIDSSGNVLVGTTSTPSGATGSIVANNASYIGSNKVVNWTKTNSSNNVTTATVVFQTTSSWFTNYISFTVSCVQANSANNFAASYLYQIATLDASGGSARNVLAQGDNAQFTVTVTGNSGTGTQTWTVSVTGPATVNRMILTLEAGSALGVNATA
jgi:hypothetical protein